MKTTGNLLSLSIFDTQGLEGFVEEVYGYLDFEEVANSSEIINYEPALSVSVGVKDLNEITDVDYIADPYSSL